MSFLCLETVVGKDKSIYLPILGDGLSLLLLKKILSSSTNKQCKCQFPSSQYSLGLGFLVILHIFKGPEKKKKRNTLLIHAFFIGATKRCMKLFPFTAALPLHFSEIMSDFTSGSCHIAWQTVSHTHSQCQHKELEKHKNRKS